jgi:hypothetical protein
MKKLILLCFLGFFLFNSSSKAQSFAVSEIVPDKFPNVAAFFSAYDHVGQHYQSLTSADFVVTDNGLVIPNELVEIRCEKDAPVSVVLVLDRSSSMQDRVDGVSKWSWAVDAAKTFINTIDLGAESQIAITSFAGTSSIISPFLRNKKWLLDSLNKPIQIVGGTNFNVAFLDDYTGAIYLLKDAPPHHKRAIVFLSDGAHESQGATLRMKDIIDEMNDNNIQLFSITLLSDRSSDLENMSKMTGGRYVMVGTKHELDNIYKSFAETISYKEHCQIIWTNPDICDTVETSRRVSIRFVILGMTVNKQYLVPFENIVYVDSDKSIIDFDNPDIGSYTERTVTITPRLKNLTTRDIRIVPAGYFKVVDWGDGVGNQPNYDFIMPVNVPRKITIRFTPQNEKTYRQAALVVDGLPCALEVDLFGGFQRIKLEDPKKADVFSKCEAIEINWSGVTDETEVDIYYSIDNGIVWTLVTTKVTGGSYTWYPDFKAANIKVKVRVSDKFTHKFAKSFGGKTDVIPTSIDVSYNNLYIYMSGFFEGTMTIGNKTLTSIGKKDFFLAKFDSDGNLVWARSDGGFQHDDIAYGVTVDEDGNAFVIGTAYAGVKFGNTSPIFPISNVPYFFIAKYSSMGDFLNLNYLGGVKDYEDFRPIPEKVSFYRVYGEQPKIYVEGRYTGQYSDYLINKSLPQSPNASAFTAVFNERLNLIDLTNKRMNNIIYTSKTAFDSDFNQYQTGDFSGSIKIGDINLQSLGGKDSFLSKYGKLPVSESISDEFVIEQPQLSFSVPIVNFPDCTWGDSLEIVITGFIVNKSKLPTKITGTEIRDFGQTEMYLDFELLTDLIDVALNPGESIEVKFKFRPAYLNLRRAEFVVTGECMNDIKIELAGNGICGGIVREEYDFGEVNLNKTVTDTIFCAFKNNSNYRVFIDPKIRGAHIFDYIISFPDYVTRINNRIKVDPDECIDVIISFTPREMDERIADLNFFVESPCKNAVTALKGFGISADVRVTSFDWERQRVNGTYNGEIRIRNNSNGIEYIDDIKFADNDGGAFTFNLQSQLPFSIAANGEERIPVTFNPTQEIDYEKEILVTVRSKTANLVSTLQGTGYLPKLIATWQCGESVVVGQSTTAKLRIENPSKSSDLSINEIYFLLQNTEYAWESGSNPTNLTIAMEDILEIPVTFTPASGSDHLNTIIIMADNYDAQFTEEWRENRLSTDCDGINLTYLEQSAFGNKLICSDNENSLTITNTSKDSDIILYFTSHTFIGDMGFSINQTDDVIVKGGENFTFKIRFEPKRIGSYMSTLKIPNSASIPIEVELTGSAGELTIQPDKAEYTFDAGKIFDYNVFLKLPNLNNDALQSLKLTISFDNSVIRYINNSFKSELNTNPANGDYWVWDKVDYLGFGQLELTGSGNVTSTQSFEAFKIQFMTLLNDMGQSPIFATLDYDCYTAVNNLSVVNINEVCFNDNRIIYTASAIRFFLGNPSPNPALTDFKINYGIAFETEVKLNIFDVEGNLVMSLVDGILKAANYEIILNTSDFNSGVYFIKLEAGPFNETKSIMIAK